MVNSAKHEKWRTHSYLFLLKLCISIITTTMHICNNLLLLNSAWVNLDYPCVITVGHFINNQFPLPQLSNIEIKQP